MSLRGLENLKLWWREKHLPGGCSRASGSYHIQCLHPEESTLLSLSPHRPAYAGKASQVGPVQGWEPRFLVSVSALYSIVKPTL